MFNTSWTLKTLKITLLIRAGFNSDKMELSKFNGTYIYIYIILIFCYFKVLLHYILEVNILLLVHYSYVITLVISYFADHIMDQSQSSTLTSFKVFIANQRAYVLYKIGPYVALLCWLSQNLMLNYIHCQKINFIIKYKTIKYEFWKI